MFNSPAKRKPEDDPERAKLDDSVDEEEKDQVSLALYSFFTLPFWGTCADNCNCIFGLSCFKIDLKQLRY